MSFCCPIHGYYHPVPGATVALCPGCSKSGVPFSNGNPVTTIQPAIVLQPSDENVERAVKHVQDFAAKQGGLNVESCANAGRIRDVVREAIDIAIGRVHAA